MVKKHTPITLSKSPEVLAIDLVDGDAHTYSELVKNGIRRNKKRIVKPVSKKK